MAVYHLVSKTKDNIHILDENINACMDEKISLMYNFVPDINESKRVPFMLTPCQSLASVEGTKDV